MRDRGRKHALPVGWFRDLEHHPSPSNISTAPKHIHLDGLTQFLKSHTEQLVRHRLDGTEWLAVHFHSFIHYLGRFIGRQQPDQLFLFPPFPTDRHTIPVVWYGRMGNLGGITWTEQNSLCFSFPSIRSLHSSIIGVYFFLAFSINLQRSFIIYPLPSPRGNVTLLVGGDVNYY